MKALQRMREWYEVQDHLGKFMLFMFIILFPMCLSIEIAAAFPCSQTVIPAMVFVLVAVCLSVAKIKSL